MPRADPQQAADIEMLARLRLDGFVGGDHEQHQIDAAHAGQHILDEALVAGHVDEAQAQVRGKLEMSEADIDGDAAALLFLQAVGVDAGQGFDERGLAVIDVAGRADDDIFSCLLSSYWSWWSGSLGLLRAHRHRGACAIARAAARKRAAFAADQRAEAAGRSRRRAGRESAQLLRAGISASSRFCSPCAMRDRPGDRGGGEAAPRSIPTCLRG